MMKKHWKLIIAVFCVLGAAIYSMFLLMTAPGGAGSINGTFHEAGEFLGAASALVLILINGRSLLKMGLRKESLWESLDRRTLSGSALIKTTSQRLVVLLTKLHPLLGLISVGGVYLHCFLTDAPVNLFLKIALFLVAWQSIAGLILYIRATPRYISKSVYRIHGQFIVAVSITACAAFGHLPLLK